MMHLYNHRIFQEKIKSMKQMIPTSRCPRENTSKHTLPEKNQWLRGWHGGFRPWLLEEPSANRVPLTKPWLLDQSKLVRPTHRYRTPCLSKPQADTRDRVRKRQVPNTPWSMDGIFQWHLIYDMGRVWECHGKRPTGSICLQVLQAMSQSSCPSLWILLCRR